MQKNKNLLLSGVRQSKVTYCDKDYTLSGAIFHRGKTASRDHYTTVVLKVKYWFKADATKISKCSRRRNSKHVDILFLEKNRINFTNAI